MKILHCCLSCFYVDNFNYQENILPRQNKEDGHDVKILASTETFIDGELGYVSEGRYINEDKIEVTRVPYKKFLPHRIMRKLRFYKNVRYNLERFKPDIIFFHGTAAGELNTISKYMKKNSGVTLYLDSHEDFNNTARTIPSKFFYKHIQGIFLKKVLKYTKKIFYISRETKEYLKEMYNITEEKLEWYPLGGIIFEPQVYNKNREEIRESLGIGEKEILFVHSGKMDKLKRTSNILRAFTNVKDERFRLALIGSFPDEVWEDVRKYIETDDRISYLGWKSGEELLEYLCAADMYLQPGTQSATLQNAMCCRCAVMIYPYSSHQDYLKGNGFFVKDEGDIEEGLKQISVNPDMLVEMQKKSEEIAEKDLDYKKLAAKIYQ